MSERRRVSTHRAAFLLLGCVMVCLGGCSNSDTSRMKDGGSPGGSGGKLDQGNGGALPASAGGGTSMAGKGGTSLNGGSGGTSVVGKGGASTSGGSGGTSVVGKGGASTSGGSANPPGNGGAPPSDDAGGQTPDASAGDVHVVKRMGDPSFDALVTNPSASSITWLNEHFYRMEVFTTFFDDKTSFYANGWVYSDSQVIYPKSTTATSHPDWILQDSGGHPVYLDWNCSNGSCPQYAADVANPAFRSNWIALLKSALAKGYRGAWIDDVNLALRFSDGTKTVNAHSPATNAVMTEDTWSAAVASFMTEIATSIPGYELLHNSIWYARPTRTADPYVEQQIAAATVINMEGGFASDGGLTGGTAQWSVYAKMNFADAVHGAGKWVVVDDFPTNDTQRQYALACYFLVSNGKDGLGDNTMAPSTWWKGYDVHLGAPRSARTRNSAGLFRREFEHGVVLMLEPGAATTKITLPAPYATLDGAEVTELTLSAKQGAVLSAK